MAKAPAFSAVADDYLVRWHRMKVLAGRQTGIDAAARKIMAGKPRYRNIERSTGIPWYVVGLLHYRESDCNFHTHLHNGDPLSHRTVQVPAGRPVQGNPPFTWEASALDALRMRGLNSVATWTLERIAYEGEAYNGWGYRTHHVTSAYLWGGTDQHARGKFVRDHVYDADAPEPQEGIMPILQALMRMDLSVRPAGSGSTPAPTEPQVPPTEPKAPTEPQEPTGEPKGMGWSKTGWSSIVATVTAVATAVGQTMDSLRPILASPMTVAIIVVVAVGLGGFIWWDRRQKMYQHGI